MQRPRNRQGHTQQSDRGRGRGRGRAGFRGGHSGPDALRAPNINQVTSGAFVSIVLKVDQPTSREVQGIVADVLTNGNHPRGIKVRLVDGRVGRVQRMVSEETARAGSEGMSGLGRNGEPTGGMGSGVTPQPRSRFTAKYHDVREEEEMNVPSSNYSLGDFLPPGHPLRDDPPLHHPTPRLLHSFARSAGKKRTPKLPSPTTSLRTSIKGFPGYEKSHQTTCSRKIMSQPYQQEWEETPACPILQTLPGNLCASTKHMVADMINWLIDS